MAMQTLTRMQQLFVEYYVESGNRIEACRKAGYKGDRSALSANAYKMLKKPHIQAYYQEKLAEYKEEHLPTIENIMEFWRGTMMSPDNHLTHRLRASENIMKHLEGEPTDDEEITDINIVIVEEEVDTADTQEVTGGAGDDEEED